jgi:hypothetical protein
MTKDKRCMRKSKRQRSIERYPKVLPVSSWGRKEAKRITCRFQKFLGVVLNCEKFNTKILAIIFNFREVMARIYSTTILLRCGLYSHGVSLADWEG